MELLNRLIRALTELHPLHPMLVHFPIGLTGASCFFILLALWRKSPLLEQIAFANISLATIATMAAGITGIRDNIVNYEGQAPNAGLKIVLASLLLSVTTITSLLRWRNPDVFEKQPIRWLYVSAYGISFGLAIVLGFLGGVILYGF